MSARHHLWRGERASGLEHTVIQLHRAQLPYPDAFPAVCEAPPGPWGRDLRPALVIHPHPGLDRERDRQTAAPRSVAAPPLLPSPAPIEPAPWEPKDYSTARDFGGWQDAPLGVGHLKPESPDYLFWPPGAIVPIYAAPGGRHLGWVESGWVTTDGTRVPLSWAGLVETGYEVADRGSGLFRQRGSGRQQRAKHGEADACVADGSVHDGPSFRIHDNTPLRVGAGLQLRLR